MCSFSRQALIACSAQGMLPAKKERPPDHPQSGSETPSPTSLHFLRNVTTNLQDLLTCHFKMNIYKNVGIRGNIAPTSHLILTQQTGSPLRECQQNFLIDQGSADPARSTRQSWPSAPTELVRMDLRARFALSHARECGPLRGRRGPNQRPSPTSPVDFQESCNIHCEDSVEKNNLQHLLQKTSYNLKRNR